MGRISDAVDRLDTAVGNGLERLVRDHHRRRLIKLGHPASGANPVDGTCWTDGDTPARDGNDVEIIIDGDRMLAAIAEAIAGARSHVHIAGWHLQPEFRLTREPGAPTLVELLTAAAERVEVRVLLWAGPPLPFFQPTRGAMKKVRKQLTAAGRVRCVLDARERTLHCHHEKIVVIDDEVAFVGGIDLSALSGDRWDRDDHPPRRKTGWHDLGSRLRGPIVTDVAHHFRARWQEVAREALPAPAEQQPAGHHTVQLVRTVPEKTYAFAPKGHFGNLAAYSAALRGAERLIYLENQFLWSTEINDILVDKLRNPPHPDFRLLLVLPSRPSSGKDTTRGQLAVLIDADDGAGRLLATTIRAVDAGVDGSVYVHAKVGIVDDRWLTLGSANLNEHSLYNDTEVNIVTDDRELARTTRLRLWSEHLQQPVHEISGQPADVIDQMWKPVAKEQLERSRQNLPPTRRLIELPALSRRSERLEGPVRGLLVDG